MRIADLVETLESIAPASNAESWDNVGLLVGDPAREIAGPAVLAIDFTRPILEEALARRAGVVIAYHPPIFHPLQRLDARDPRSRTLLGAIEAGIAIYSPHSALDATPGGTTDWLCDMLAPPGEKAKSFGDRRALAPTNRVDARQAFKIVTFVPAEQAERVRDALASAGAGRIGAYEQCSFMLQGVGTFRGGAGTNPTVGKAGRLEHAEEVRLEMVCPARALPLAQELLMQFHPYEEPAWDVYPLAPKPNRSIGPGRRLTLDRPAPAQELATRLKQNLGIDAVKLASANDEPVERIGVCPGAGASLLDTAIDEGCQMFVTGEMRHHEALAAIEKGVSILLAGHTNTERGFLPIYAERIREKAPGLEVIHASADGPIFRTR
jgi:dinuclear metal center YbgI/SA1388 family protein